MVQRLARDRTRRRLVMQGTDKCAFGDNLNVSIDCCIATGTVEM